MPADGTSAAKIKKRGLRYVPVFVGNSWASFISLSMETHMGARHAKHNRGLRIYLCVQAQGRNQPMRIAVCPSAWAR